MFWSHIAEWREEARKRKALYEYRTRLRVLLGKRYGASRYYTQAQVKRTLETSGFNTDYSCYAYANYCTRDDFDAYHQLIGETCDYAQMNSEMGNQWSGEDTYEINVSHDTSSFSDSHFHGDGGHSDHSGFSGDSGSSGH